jgi:hypothetical protein
LIGIELLTCPHASGVDPPPVIYKYDDCTTFTCCRSVQEVYKKCTKHSHTAAVLVVVSYCLVGRMDGTSIPEWNRSGCTSDVPIIYMTVPPLHAEVPQKSHTAAVLVLVLVVVVVVSYCLVLQE